MCVDGGGGKSRMLSTTGGGLVGGANNSCRIERAAAGLVDDGGGGKSVVLENDSAAFFSRAKFSAATYLGVLLLVAPSDGKLSCVKLDSRFPTREAALVLVGIVDDDRDGNDEDDTAAGAVVVVPPPVLQPDDGCLAAHCMAANVRLPETPPPPPRLVLLSLARVEFLKVLVVLGSEGKFSAAISFRRPILLLAPLLHPTRNAAAAAVLLLPCKLGKASGASCNCRRVRISAA
mmetsp:Transcript_728/g.1343  ORF Transcript_728/g.1343 Transcript_728/m.1343 type:complete len:233 (-) Transcript_728:846-1544(-)